MIRRLDTWAPIKSTLARTVSKLLGVSKNTDLSLRGNVQISRAVVPPFEASGGTTNPYSEGGSNYISHTFTSSSDFVVTSGARNIDYLLVGGGGGGGQDIGGGGGGGGYRILTDQPITPGTYPVVVGTGGKNSSSII